MGGESSYLFTFDPHAPYLLRKVPREEWQLPSMHSWTDSAISALLDTAELALNECVRTLHLPAQLIRKERAVGIVPLPGGGKFSREQLEETVLVTSQIIGASDVGGRIPFCAFNGGNDVFVDIGDKSWGVRVCQRFLGGIGRVGGLERVGGTQGKEGKKEGEEGEGIPGARTLHVGDQFLSAGANDFKARLACTTAWIASPEETGALLDELQEHMGKQKREGEEMVWLRE